MSDEEASDAYELRLAVVMYGGVSLAVYMNGIATELYRLVRATAPNRLGGGYRLKDAASTLEPLQPSEMLTSTELVYRKLATRLTRGLHGLRLRVKTDVLSGSSAGGINAVCLAKALATGGDFQPVSALWRKDADLKALLQTDRGPYSLLDGDAFFKLLARALDEYQV